MNKYLRKRLSFLLIFIIIISGGPAIAYGQPPEDLGAHGNPFKMMVNTASELISAEEILRPLTPEDIIRDQMDEFIVDLNTKIKRKESGIEDIRRVIEKKVKPEKNGNHLESSLFDNILARQERLIEESKTDRFIVKYRNGSENSFKEKTEDFIKESVTLNDMKLTKRNIWKKTTDIQDSIYEIEPDTIASAILAEGDNDKAELLILKNSINPADFAEQLREKGVEGDIEYIQPDFKMELNSLNEQPDPMTETVEQYLTIDLDSTEDQGVDEENAGEQDEDQSDEVVTDDTENTEIVVDFTDDETSTEEAITSEPVEEESALSEAITTKEAITTEEAILEERPFEESQNKVVVAIIDTGIDITHPDLEESIYVNPNEISGNGIDDDDNGYIDDINGWNFPDNSGIVYDKSFSLESAHATHIAGIIAGLSNADNNLIPNDNIEILPLKVFNNGVAYTSDIIAAIEYAEIMGAQVINCSFGSTNNNPALKEAMENSGMLFVCSAGNARTDLDITPNFPACFDLDNVISVTSTNADGGLSYFSNYSSNLVDVAALGRDINSTLPNAEYGLQNGTSMSTALVSGIAATVLTMNNTLDSEELKAWLSDTADKLSNLQEVVADGRQINVLNAMKNQEQTDIIQNSPESDFDVKGYNPTQSELYQLYSSGKVVQVSAGGDFSLALKDDGTVWAWGDNSAGQCGNGSTSGSVKQVQVIGLTEVVSIAAGGNYSLAMKSNGTVWAWGNNFYGQLGDGTTINRTTPVQVSGLTDMVSVSAGNYHSLAVKSDGTVWTWGYNDIGQLGDGATINRTTPVQVSGLTDVVSIAGGSYHSLAVKADGTVWTWGYNYYGQLGDGITTNRTTPVQVSGLTDIVSVAGGSYHSLAMKADGTVWAWGWNVCGQLGEGTTTDRTTPVQVNGLTDIVNITAGGTQNIALKSDGKVWSWGDNDHGQLGDGTTTDRTVPVQVSGILYVISVAAGYNHSLAIKSDGTVWIWGNNDCGQLGDGTSDIKTTPALVSSFNDAINISAGYYHSLATKSNGTVWSWGNNEYGQLGDDTTTNRTTPVQVIGLTNVVDVAAGSAHNLALKSDGTIWAWGNNEYRQLGDGTTTNRTTPVQVVGLTNVVDVAAGGAHSLALKSDGTIWAWGNNQYGQLGDGTVSNWKTPVQIGLTNVIDVAASERNSLALKADGTVWVWGDNSYGQLGDGTWEASATPLQVSDLSNIVSLDGGICYNLAVKADGTVWAWGYNRYGQLGDGTTTNRTIPVQVYGLTNVNCVTAGYGHSLAMKLDGTVWAWGRNNNGEFGDGTTTSSTMPVRVSGLTDVINVDGGSYHSLSVKSDGNIAAWGMDSYGQLGQSRLIQSNIPIQCPTYTGQLSFENVSYTADIPKSGLKTTTVSAIGTDSDGNTIPASSIYYCLADTHPGVSINSSTGAVTIDSTAQPGIVQLQAVYQNLTCGATLTLTLAPGGSLHFSTTADRIYCIPITVNNISSFSGKPFSLTYDSSVLELIDLCAFTSIKETTAGDIPGKGITITSISNGIIVFTVDKDIPTDKQWSGIVDVIKFKAITTGETSISAEDYQ